jgi:hypothetical protein
MSDPIYAAGGRVSLAMARGDSAAELAARRELKTLRLLRDFDRGVDLTLTDRQMLATKLLSGG